LSVLLRLCGAIDRLNGAIGRAVTWAVLAMTLISSGNALIRYGFNISSNAWLEIQWYLFSAVFLLCAGYTLRHNEHIRIDVIAGRFSRRTQAWIEVLGGALFLLPMACLILWLSWPIFMGSFTSGEMSSDAGGLVRWPAKLLIPVGFALLALQGVSETVKRLAFLLGMAPDPAAREDGAHG